MNDDVIARIEGDARYHDLVARRSRFGWMMSGAMFAIFVGFILLVAFDKRLLAAPIGDGVTSIGIPVGIGVIVAGIVLTGLYVRHANRVYDREMAEILKDAAL